MKEKKFPSAVLALLNVSAIKTRVAIGKIAGVHKTTVGQWIKGTSLPEEETLEMLLRSQRIPEDLRMGLRDGYEHDKTPTRTWTELQELRRFKVAILEPEKSPLLMRAKDLAGRPHASQIAIALKLISETEWERVATPVIDLLQSEWNRERERERQETTPLPARRAEGR